MILLLIILLFLLLLLILKLYTSYQYDPIIPTIHSHCTTTCGGHLICDPLCHRCRATLNTPCSSTIDCQSGLHCINYRCIQEPSIQTPSIQTPSIQTPSIQTPSIQNPSIEGSIQEPSIQRSPLIPHLDTKSPTKKVHWNL